MGTPHQVPPSPSEVCRTAGRHLWPSKREHENLGQQVLHAGFKGQHAVSHEFAPSMNPWKRPEVEVNVTGDLETTSQAAIWVQRVVNRIPVVRRRCPGIRKLTSVLKH